MNAAEWSELGPTKFHVSVILTDCERSAPLSLRSSTGSEQEQKDHGDVSFAIQQQEFARVSFPVALQKSPGLQSLNVPLRYRATL